MRISHTILSIALGCGLNSAVVADSIIDDPDSQTQKPCIFNNVYQNHTSNGFLPVKFRRRGEDGPSELWTLNVSEGGHFCYLSKEDVKLWRADTSKPATLVIEIEVAKDKFEEVAQVRFRRNKDTKKWPRKKNLAPGVYTMKLGDTTNTVTLHKIPANEANKVKWMEDQGCTQQAEMYQPEVADNSL